MKRIQTSTAVANKFGVGKAGFTDGDPVTGIPTTDLEGRWFDQTQEAIVRTVEAAGLVPSDDLDQFTAAIVKLIKARVLGHGQCRLIKSGANLVLQPFNGNQLIINSAQQSIPTAGVSLAPAGLLPSTVYFIYAYMNDAAVALEASATGHTTDADTGVEIKTGDPTRTLVGIARTIAGPAWQDTAAQRFVESYFNQPVRTGKNLLPSAISTTATVDVELSAVARCEWVSLKTNVSAQVSGYLSFDSSGTTGFTGIGIDSTTASESGGTAISQNTATFQGPAAVMATKAGLAEGYHYATILAHMAGGSGTWQAITTINIQI